MKPRNRRSSGLRRIARLAGVSPATVSKVLNHYPVVSDVTRQRVWEAARAMGKTTRAYRSDDAAGDAARTILLLPMEETLFRELEREPARLTPRGFDAFQQTLVGASYDLLLGPGGLSEPEAVAYVHDGAWRRL